MKDRSRFSPSVLLLALLLGVSFIECSALIGAGRVHSNDFKHLWLGTRVLEAGGSPYDAQMLLTAARQYGIESVNPYVYLPATAVFLAPFAAMGYKAGLLAWFAFNWLLVWGCVLAGPHWMRLERPERARLLGALFLVGSMPFMRQMTAGQMNIIVLAAVLFALGALMRRRDLSGGIVLGLAAAFKIAPFFFLLPLLGLKRWRAAGGLAAGFIAANLAAVIWFGGDVHVEALPVLRQMGYGQSTWAQFGMDFYRDPFNQSFNSLFHHLLTENPYTRPWSDLGTGMANGLTWLASILMLGMYAVFLLRYWMPTLPERAGGGAWGDRETVLFLAASLLMLLLPSLMWDHYSLQALPALFWLAGSPSLGRPIARSMTVLVAFALMSLPWMHTREAFTHGAGILLMSIRLWGMLLLAGYLFVESDRQLGRAPDA